MAALQLQIMFSLVRKEKCGNKNIKVCYVTHITTVMRCLTTGIRSEKCVVRRFRLCVNVVECTYINLDSIAYYTPRLYGIAYCSYATNLYIMLLHTVDNLTQW
jgi:hypothetical protein